MKVYAVVFALVFSAYARSVVSLYGQSGFQFLASHSDVRTTSMGGAGTGSRSVLSRYRNPAASADYASLTGQFGVNHFGSGKRFSGEIFYPFNNYFAAATFTNFTEDDIGVTGELQTWAPTHFASWQSSAFDFTAGVYRTPWLTWAISCGAAFEKFEGESAYAFVFNAGALLFFADSTLTLGLSALNLGRTTSFIEDSSNEKLGTGEDLPTQGRAGLSLLLEEGWRRVELSTDIVYHHAKHPGGAYRDDWGDRLLFPVGAELTIHDWLSFRAGKKIGHHTDRFAFGMAISNTSLKAETAFQIRDYDGDSELAWSFGITYSLRPPKKEPVPVRSFVFEADTIRADLGHLDLEDQISPYQLDIPEDGESDDYEVELYIKDDE